MDSYSGRIPLNFISFYLGMTTETQDTSGVTTEDSHQEELDQAVPGSVNTTSEPRPPSNFSVSSEATEESLSNYAERTMKAIIAGDQPGTSGISALLSPLNERTEGTSEDKNAEHKRPDACPQGDPEVSQHTGIEKTVFGQAEQNDASIVSIPVVSRLIDPTLYFTDTSEIEDLMDIRYYQTESHLRKDQIWRYTHLKKVDTITGITTHQVRGKNGVILTPLELEKEKPLFENAPLVDLGGEFPFLGRILGSDGRTAND